MTYNQQGFLFNTSQLSMKIYSWNICDANKKLSEALTYIESLDFDVLCLQEIPKPFLKKLQKLPYNIEYHMDLRRYKKGKWETIYLVILTPHKILDSKKFHIGREWKEPLRTKIFVWCMRIIGWTKNDAYGALYVDIQKGKGKFRVFSLHLHVGKPYERIKQLKKAFTHLHKKIPNILCGDFNVVDLPHTQPFNWIMGSSLKEASPFFKERKILTKLFNKHKLTNPLKNTTTHTIFKCQLDHILIPKNMKVVESRVEKDTVGSDHYPIFIKTKS